MTRQYWFISDTHFFHENAVMWSPERRFRFSCAEEANEVMIENWNRVVKPGDNIYHLGDVFLGPSTPQDRKKLWSRLNGRKTLIIGNHDNVKELTKGGYFRDYKLWKFWPDKPYLFTHVPIHSDSIKKRVGEQSTNVHGHTHDHGSPDGPYRSVCVEMNNFTPVNLDELGTI